MGSTTLAGTLGNKSVPRTKSSQRYLALDVLRGLTVALMILVNTPGSWGAIYAPFKHAPWHGFTLTDLVFPTFLFVVGNAMSFSMRKFRSQPEQYFLKKVIKRSALIFLIGLFLSAFPFVYREGGELFLKDLTQMRVMGVLQRIALCYLFASLMLRYLGTRANIVISVLILFLYWLIMYLFGAAGEPFSREGNAALKFDLLVFPPENLWSGFGFPFDPEGLLSTFPAIVNVVAGYLAGKFIQGSGNNMKTVIRLFLAGIAFVLLGEFWDLYFPINKPLWTSSYVLLTIGWDLVLISCLIWLTEVFGFRRTYFFEVFGKNPLFIYVLSGLIVMILNVILIEGMTLKSWLYRKIYLSWLTDYNASLGFAISYVILLWVIGYWLDKKKIYIKV